MKSVHFFILLIAFLLAMPACSSGQEITDVAYAGQCGDFSVTVSAEGLYNINNISDECWDVKLDVPGRVFDGSAGEAGEWNSAFYYVNDVFCPPDRTVSLRLRPSSIAPVVEGTVKLRQDNKVIEKPFTIEQDCPQPLGWEWVLIAGAAFIVFFGYLLVWWVRRK
jgi:hypothetical protein